MKLTYGSLHDEVKHDINNIIKKRLNGLYYKEVNSLKFDGKWVAIELNLDTVESTRPWGNSIVSDDSKNLLYRKYVGLLGNSGTSSLVFDNNVYNRPDYGSDYTKIARSTLVYTFASEIRDFVINTEDCPEVKSIDNIARLVANDEAVGTHKGYWYMSTLNSDIVLIYKGLKKEMTYLRMYITTGKVVL
jgi:hypothetical protein